MSFEAVRPSPLARLLLLATLLLAVYASLHPFEGWRASGVSPFAFVFAAAPRYITTADLVANVVAYLPLGFLAALSLAPSLRGGAAVTLATLGAALLSLILEAAQTYLPSRIPSNLDLACNTAGALAGALLAVPLTPWLLGGGVFRRARAAYFDPGLLTDAALLLLGLWLFAQLHPGELLFATGDLRGWIGAPAAAAQSAQDFMLIEAATTAAHTVALALIVACFSSRGAPVRRLVIGLLCVALAVKAAVFALILNPQDAFAWFTPGARYGLGAGLLVGLVLVAASRPAQHALAAVLLMAATVLVNLTPPNPYLAQALIEWPQGHALHFYGLTQLTGSAWPFAALVFLVWSAARRGRA